MVDSIKSASQEIEKVMVSYQHPYDELFNRYLTKSDGEKEVFVLALISAAMVARARRAALKNATLVNSMEGER